MTQEQAKTLKPGMKIFNGQTELTIERIQSVYEGAPVTIWTKEKGAFGAGALALEAWMPALPARKPRGVTESQWIDITLGDRPRGAGGHDE